MKKRTTSVTTLAKEMRRPAESKLVVENHDSIDSAIHQFEMWTEDHRLTFPGAYIYLWPKIRDERKLNKETAKGYDTTTVTKILKEFSGPAFEDMDEAFFTQHWNNLLNSSLPDYALARGSTVIRTLMELAYKEGLTRTILWGLPERLTSAGGVPRYTAKQDLKEEGKRLAERGVRTRRSLSLHTELLLLKVSLEEIEDSGEALGCDIMLLSGTRTSETTGFNYEHLTMVTPGYYALVRYAVSLHNARETTGGGKSDNAYRLLPLPSFLANIMLKRKQMLEEMFPDQDVGKFPICCRGKDYTCRCKQSELNEYMKGLYKRVGVDQDLLASAYCEMHEDKSQDRDSEGYATAYLCRHQFATAMVYCGLTLGEIYTVMGHKEEDENVVKADFSNPDRFRQLTDKMSRRPIVQIFDKLLEYREYTYDGSFTLIWSDYDVVIRFSEKSDVDIYVHGLESGDVVEVITDGFHIEDQKNLTYQKAEVSDTISLRGQLYQCALMEWEKVQNQEVEAIPEATMVDELALEQAFQYALSPSEVEELLEEDEVPAESESVMILEEAQEVEPEFAMVSEETQKAEPESIVDPGAVVAADMLAENFEVSSLSEADPAQGRMEYSLGEEVFCTPVASLEIGADRQMLKSRKKMRSVSDGLTLYLLDRTGVISKLPYPTTLQSTHRVGKRLPLSCQEKVPVRVFAHDPGQKSLVLSPSGMLYRIPGKKQLDDADFCAAENLAYRALCDGGVLLQGEELTRNGNDAGTIVCLANTGAIRKFRLAAFQRFPVEGRRLVRLKEHETIVAACLCPEDQDILLVSEQGKALRIAAGELRACRNGGAELYAGISLGNEDRAVACIPYVEGLEYLVVKRFGLAVRLASDFQLLPHRRAASGVVCTKIRESAEPDQAADQIVVVQKSNEGLFLLNNNGNYLFCDAQKIPGVKTPANGVKTMVLKEGQYILSALALPLPVPQMDLSESMVTER